MMTKNLTLEKIECYSELLGYEFESGRSAATAALHAVAKTSKVVIEAKSSEVATEVGEAKRWTCISATHWRGVFKNARAYRAPTCAGVKWDEIENIVTTDTHTGRILRELHPQLHVIRESEARGNIEGCADITVDAFLGSDMWYSTSRQARARAGPM